MEMNLLESWRVISDCIVAPAGELAFAGVASDVHRPVGRWHALFSDRSRPLLLPINNRQARGNSLRFFLPELWRKCYASVRLHVHDLCGVRAHLPVMTLPATAAPTLTDQLAFTESPQLAFLIGTPGPYQKASILVMTMQGEPLALTKLALGPRANSMVQGEAAWLRKLSTQSALRAQVPQLLREGVTRNGHHYLAQSVVTGRPCSRTFSPAHAEFLRRLGAMDTRITRFTHAPVCQRLRADFARLSPHLTQPRRQLLENALLDCTRQLADWRGPFVVSHGDFAVWNTRATEDRMGVFDWEYASEGTSPLFDPFHFHLIAPATSGRRLMVRDMRHALVTSRAFAQLTYPGFAWHMPIVAAHGLCYLLQTLIFYGLSRDEFVEGHPVIRSYCQLVQERAQWLQ